MAFVHEAFCSRCHRIHWDQHGRCHKSELAALSLLPTLPQEIQDGVFDFCDLHALAILCRLNKHWNKKATPLLWRDIDFVHAFADTGARIEASRRFFATCDTMIDEDLERFQSLASHVRTLVLGRVLGIYIVHEAKKDKFAYFDPLQDNDRDIFDIIAYFDNLEALSVFVKSWWGDDDIDQSGEALADKLAKLKWLKIGGQMPVGIIGGLLEHKTLERLSLINLVGCPGQDTGPDGILFLDGLENQLTNLKSLHLCKLADLEGRTFEDEDEDEEDSDYEREYVSGMRWGFPRESERAVLQEWASLLRHISSTLEELTLENRFLCSYGFDDLSMQIDPGKSHPADYGAHSFKETQRALFPILSEDWPKLKCLTLIGMGKVEDVTGAVCHLEPRVHIEQHAAGIELMKGNVTPEMISTPVYFGSGRDRFKD